MLSLLLLVANFKEYKNKYFGGLKMEVNKLKKYIDYFVEVDWKSESEDILYAIREMYGKLYNDIMKRNFDELAENYAQEETEDFINALGQELSSENLLLYEIDEDSDSYVLVVIPTEEENDLKNYLKNNKRKGKIKKQPRRKLGNIAKRIDLGKRIVCEKYLMPKDYAINFATSGLNPSLILYYMCFKPRKFDAAILDISNWPPQKGEDLGIYVRFFVDCEINGKFACVLDTTLDENGILIDKRKKLIYGYDINNMKEWKCLCSDLSIDINEMIYFDDILFLANQESVYMVNDINNFNNSITKIMDFEESSNYWYPKFFICNDNLYLHMHQCIYKFEKHHKLFKTIYGFKEIYTINEFNVGYIKVVEDNTIAFQVRPQYLRTESSWRCYTYCA